LSCFTAIVDRLKRENSIRTRHKLRFKARTNSKHSMPVAYSRDSHRFRRVGPIPLSFGAADQATALAGKCRAQASRPGALTLRICWLRCSSACNRSIRWCGGCDNNNNLRWLYGCQAWPANTRFGSNAVLRPWRKQTFGISGTPTSAYRPVPAAYGPQIVRRQWPKSGIRRGSEIRQEPAST